MLETHIPLFEAPQFSFTDFKNRIRNDTEYEEDNLKYNAFVEKFKPKKTTDDCYTPDDVYNVIVDWTVDEYKIDKEKFVRPFFPGSDYKNYKYAQDTIVVDNPPFSILTKIIDFYCRNGVKFFLFAPALTLFKNRKDVCFIAVGANITYENGAIVKTSFITNLEEPSIRSAPTLYKNLEKINQKGKVKLPKYEYPDNVLTAAMINQFSEKGLDFRVPIDETHFIRELQAQKPSKKTIFGEGFLISDKAAKAKAAKAKAAKAKAAKAKAAKAKAAKAKANIMVWELSEFEQEIIKRL